MGKVKMLLSCHEFVLTKVHLIALGDWTADSAVQEEVNALGKDKFGQNPVLYRQRLEAEPKGE